MIQQRRRVEMETTIDLFPPPKMTQKEAIYDFIKRKGRCLSHELNLFCAQNFINNGGTRARELKAEGHIWHIKPEVMVCIYPRSKEEAWSIYESDREVITPDLNRARQQPEEAKR
jgi:hypothetical protein